MYANVSLSKREPTDGELFDTWYGADDLGVSPLFAKSDTVYYDNGTVKYIEWEDPYVKEEELIDYELGCNYLTGSLEMRLNFFYMDFCIYRRSIYFIHCNFRNNKIHRARKNNNRFDCRKRYKCFIRSFRKFF